MSPSHSHSAQDQQNFNNLARAIFNGNVEQVKSLLKLGINLSALIKDKYNYTLLSLAISRGNAAIVKELISAGADPNQNFDNVCAMCYAISKNNMEMMLLLLENGAYLPGNKTVYPYLKHARATNRIDDKAYRFLAIIIELQQLQRVKNLGLMEYHNINACIDTCIEFKGDHLEEILHLSNLDYLWKNIQNYESFSQGKIMDIMQEKEKGIDEKTGEAEDWSYREKKGGVCLGMSQMAVNAILASDESLDEIQHFDERLRFLSGLKPHEHQEKLKQTRETVAAFAKESKKEVLAEFSKEGKNPPQFKNAHALTDEEKKQNIAYQSELNSRINQKVQTKIKESKIDVRLLETSPFFEGIDIVQHHSYYEHLYPKGFAPKSQNPQLAAPLVNSIKLEKMGGAKIAHSVSGIYNQQELEALYLSLRDAISNKAAKMNRPVALMLRNRFHAIAIGFDPNTKRWLFFDPNQLPLQYASDEALLAEKIMSAFPGDAANPYVAMTTDIYFPPNISSQEVITTWRKSPGFTQVHDPNEKEIVTRRDTEGVAWIHSAARQGDAKMVQALLKHEKDPVQLFQSLMIAIQYENIDTISLLLNSNKIDLTYCHASIHYGKTALTNAVLNDNLVIIEMLLKKSNASINNQQDRDGYSALHFATIEGNVKVIDLLLKQKGISINIYNNQNETPLAMAIKFNNLQAAKVIIDFAKKSDVYIDLDGNDHVPFILKAVKNGNQALLDLMLDANESPDIKDKNNKSLLLIAIENKNEVMIDKLLAAGADPNIPDANGNPVLLTAIKNNDITLVTKLLSHKAIVNDEVLLCVIKNNRYSIVEMLIAQNKIDINNKQGTTPLMFAVQYADKKMVEILLKLGADPNIESQGSTPLTVAMQSDRLDIMQTILESEKGIKKQLNLSRGDLIKRPLLGDAILGNKLEAAELLLKAGVSLNSKIDIAGDNYLLKAIYVENPKMVALLLKYGADPNNNVSMYAGDTPLKLAVRTHQFEIVNSLLDAGARFDPKDKEENGYLYLCKKREIETYFDKIEAILKTNKGVNFTLKQVKNVCEQTKFLFDNNQIRSFENLNYFTKCMKCVLDVTMNPNAETLKQLQVVVDNYPKPHSSLSHKLLNNLMDTYTIGTLAVLTTFLGVHRGVEIAFALLSPISKAINSLFSSHHRKKDLKHSMDDLLHTGGIYNNHRKKV